MQASQEERFLGFDPAHFIDDVHNVATDYAADCIDKVEEELLNDPVVGPMHAEMLSKGVEKAYEIVKQRLDVNFDKFELYCLRNIFAVPEHVDLEATMQLAQPPQIRHRYTAQQEADLDAELRDLRQNLCASIVVQERMLKETNQLSALLLQCDTFEEELFQAQIDSGVDVDALLSQSVPQALAAAKSMQQRSSQLQHLIQRLDDSEPATADPAQFVDSAFARMRRSFGCPSVNELASINAALAAH